MPRPTDIFYLLCAEVIQRLVDPATGAPVSRTKATPAMTKMKSELAVPGALISVDARARACVPFVPEAVVRGFCFFAASACLIPHGLVQKKSASAEQGGAKRDSISFFGALCAAPT